MDRLLDFLAVMEEVNPHYDIKIVPLTDSEKDFRFVLESAPAYGNFDAGPVYEVLQQFSGFSVEDVAQSHEEVAAHRKLIEVTV